ncbi:MAG: hypothetical protein JNK49_05390 [Planctomycetes bacterium]|nr:hypothetical protein [Planctomycetota bacterium]
MDLKPVLQGVLPPLAAALLLVGLGGPRLVAAAVAIGAFVAYVLLKQWPALPTELWSSPNGTEWLLWTLLGALLLATLEHARVLRGRVALGAALLLAGLGPWLLLMKVAARWSLDLRLLHLGGGGLAAVLLVWLWRRYLQRATPGLLPGVLGTVLLSGDAALLAGQGSALLGQMCGAFAAALGAGCGTWLWRRTFALGSADGTWIGLAHALFLLAGVHLSSLPWSFAVAMALAPGLLLLQPFAKRATG